MAGMLRLLSNHYKSVAAYEAYKDALARIVVNEESAFWNDYPVVPYPFDG